MLAHTHAFDTAHRQSILLSDTTAGLLQASWPEAAKTQQAPAKGGGRGKAEEVTWPGPLLDHPQLRDLLEADKDSDMLQAADAELVALLSQPAPKQAWYKAARVLQAHRAAGKKPSALCQEAVAAWITTAAAAAERSAPGVAAAAAHTAGGGAQGAEAAAADAAERSGPGVSAAAASAAGGGADGAEAAAADAAERSGPGVGAAAASAAGGSAEGKLSADEPGSGGSALGRAGAAAAGPESSADGTLNVRWCLHTLASVWAQLALRDAGGAAARTLPEVLPALQRCLDVAGGAAGASLHIYARGAMILALPRLRTARALEDAVAATDALSWDAMCVCAALRTLRKMCAAPLDMPGGRARVWSGKVPCMCKP